MEIRIEKEVQRFIESLEKPTIARALRTIDLLETFGHKLGMPHSKKVAPKLFELRIHGAQSVRLFYAFQRGKARILHAFVKKSNKIPSKELKFARSKLSSIDKI